MPMEMQQALQQTWRRIETTVPGVRFNFDFWTATTPIRSTYPACRALLAARQQGPDCETRLLRAIQSAYYQQARNPSLLDTLEQCAAETGLDTVAFGRALRSPAIEQALQHDIQTSRGMGVTAYPSLRLLHEGQQSAITVDYSTHQTMLEQIADLLNQWPRQRISRLSQTMLLKRRGHHEIMGTVLYHYSTSDPELSYPCRCSRSSANPRFITLTFPLLNALYKHFINHMH
jgi:putative protein-disulfide isomerase